jgi:hypothetical protein
MVQKLVAAALLLFLFVVVLGIEVLRLVIRICNWALEWISNWIGDAYSIEFDQTEDFD